MGETKFIDSMENGRHILVCWRETTLEVEVQGIGRGGIFQSGYTNLAVINSNLTAARFRNDLLVPYVQLFMQLPGHGMAFQQDNTRQHVVRIDLDHLERSHPTCPHLNFYGAGLNADSRGDGMHLAPINN